MTDFDKGVADYYTSKAAEARRIEEQIDDALCNDAPERVLQRLREQLERARYVGD